MNSWYCPNRVAPCAARLFHEKRLAASGSAMKLRHAAALVLAGWYLFTPPIGVDKTGRAIPGTMNTAAPLSDWLAVNTVFDSLAECKKAQRDLAAFQKSDPVRHDADMHGLCVREDDPRLPK